MTARRITMSNAEVITRSEHAESYLKVAILVRDFGDVEEIVPRS